MRKEYTNHEKYTMPGSTLLYPVPVVMVSCQGKNNKREDERANIITIAWTGTVCSDPPMVSISVRKSRHSHSLISQTKEFVINLVDESLLTACDYCGVRSGSKEDKFAAMSLTPVPAKGLNCAPAILESPVSLSCKVVSVTQLGSHDMFLANVVAVTADKKHMNKDNKLCLEKAQLVTYLHGDYYGLGEQLGFFGSSVASKAAYHRRMKGAKPMAKAKAPINKSSTSRQESRTTSSDSSRSVSSGKQKTNHYSSNGRLNSSSKGKMSPPKNKSK